MEVISAIHTFNHEAGLVNGYNDQLESSLLMEEAIEGFTTPKYVHLNTEINSPKEASREFVAHLGPFIGKDVDRLDKACDATIIAIGSMVKLNLTPDQIERALQVVIKANQAKLASPLDSYGKLTKPEGFTGPEEELQLILDERGET